MSDELVAWGGGTGFEGHVLVPTILTAVSLIGADAIEKDAESAATGSKMGEASLALSFVTAAIPGGSEEKAATSALIKDATENPSNWRAIGAFAEEALGKKAKGGVSIQTVIQNKSGDELVQHTLLDRSGKVVEQHYRPMYKPRDVDKP